MKKFFIAIIIIFILLALVTVLFVFTFDANRYKAVLITKLEESMGRDLAIDNISLSLWHGLGIEAKGIVVKDKDKTWDDPLLKIKSLNASIRIPPLLKKDIQIQRLSIPDLSVNTGSGTDFKCAIDLKVDVLINSVSQIDMLKTLSAKGKMKVNNAVLENMNVLNAALDKLNMLPGLVQKLKDKLPERYGKLLKQNYTAFKPMDADFEIRDAMIYFNELLVESDAFYLTSKGSVGIADQSLNISSNFFIPKDLSEAFIGAVPELEYLADDKGLITMPLDIRGKVPSVSVMPNLNYVLQKLIKSKGQELLQKLFKSR